VKSLSDAARARLDRVLPALLHAATRSPQPDAALKRVLGLLQAVLRRTSYLALLDEQPARWRLVDVLARSALLAERLARIRCCWTNCWTCACPADARCRRHAGRVPAGAGGGRSRIRTALAQRDAAGAQLPHGDGHAGWPPGAVDSTRQLAELAQAVVVTVLAMAEADMRAAHGAIPGGRFAIIGYGSLGGLNWASVPIWTWCSCTTTRPAWMPGARPLEPGRWYARLAQKVMALLGAVTAAGRLYDIDVRLRPDGGKGSLVSSLASYTEYQRERAWTWEHQALVRAWRGWRCQPAGRFRAGACTDAGA
jgi:glutamate-ammonia-ligase adenylyltransferase